MNIIPNAILQLKRSLEQSSTLTTLLIYDPLQIFKVKLQIWSERPVQHALGRQRETTGGGDGHNLIRLSSILFFNTIYLVRLIKWTLAHARVVIMVLDIKSLDIICHAIISLTFTTTIIRKSHM